MSDLSDGFDPSTGKAAPAANDHPGTVMTAQIVEPNLSSATQAFL